MDNAGLGALTQVILLMQRTQQRDMRVLIEPAAPFEFAYTRVRTDTGEAVWRWPFPSADNTAIEPVGQIVDLAA